MYTCIVSSIDFNPKKIEEREEYQELWLHIQAPARALIAHPSTSESHPSTGEIISPQHRLDRHHLRPIAPQHRLVNCKSFSFSTHPIFFSLNLSSIYPFSLYPYRANHRKTSDPPGDLVMVFKNGPRGRTEKIGNWDENWFFKPKESDFLLILWTAKAGVGPHEPVRTVRSNPLAIILFYF